MLPRLTKEYFGSRCMTDWHSTVFPQPDSPTRQRISPSFTVRSTPRTASTSPFGVRKLTARSFSSKTGSDIATPRFQAASPVSDGLKRFFDFDYLSSVHSSMFHMTPTAWWPRTRVVSSPLSALVPT